MFLDESPLSMELWLRTLGISSLTSVEINPFENEDVLVPAFDSEMRRSSVFLSSAVVLMTLLWNGCLESAYAFSLCGIPVGIIVIVTLGILADRSMYLLWTCARKTGSNNYGGIIRISFGARAHWFSNGLMFFFLLVLLSRSMSITRDLVVPFIQHHIPDASPFLIMFWMQILLFPAFWQYCYHSLWLSVYIAVVAMTIASLILIFESNQFHSDNRGLYHSLPETFNSTFGGINVFLTNSVASFNILYIQTSLRTPTVERMQKVVRLGVIWGLVLTAAIGIAGYHLSGITDHEIPLNLLDHEALKSFSVAGRALHVTFGIAIWLTSPLILIPCRDNILEMIETLIVDGQCPEISDCQDEIETWTTRSSTANGSGSGRHNNLVIIDESSHLLPSIEETPRCELNLNPFAHYGSILGILVVAEVLAMSTTIVPILWSILSPSMSIWIAYAMPAACYLEIHKRQRQGYLIFCKAILIMSILFSFLCTVQAVRDAIIH